MFHNLTIKAVLWCSGTVQWSSIAALMGNFFQTGACGMDGPVFVVKLLKYWCLE